MITSPNRPSAGLAIFLLPGANALQVKQLIVEGGRVTGVVAEIGGAERRIGARSGVLLAAGGFSRNQATVLAHDASLIRNGSEAWVAYVLLLAAQPQYAGWFATAPDVWPPDVSSTLRL